ncbi:hypothetical protein NP572_19635 [Pseudomonas putida]|uniref:hypothetical protein n=1 Tax=Pseudomonas putida TaxID=303 RepID=UPI0023643429|nr:hypothetical protein [Pseudomonas putida]MDD2038724.1 hypothetical protein [Pseudomonas putida]MDD2044331.1 hypothetical protein [Pseudomonas putida]
MSFKVTNSTLDEVTFYEFVDTAFEKSGNPHKQLDLPRIRMPLTPEERRQTWLDQIARGLKNNDDSKIQDYIYASLLRPSGIHQDKCMEAASFYRSLRPAFKTLGAAAYGIYNRRYYEMNSALEEMIQALEKCSAQRINFKVTGGLHLDLPMTQ